MKKEYIAAEVLEIGSAANLILGDKDDPTADFNPSTTHQEGRSAIDVD